MKTSILFLAGLLFVNYAFGQTKDVKDYLKQLPKDLKLDNSSVRSYEIITDYYNYNLASEFLGKKRVAGIVSYGLENDSARWENVYTSDSGVLDAEYPQTPYKDFMQGFTYIPDDRVVTPEFARNHLPEADTFIMNLVWDALCFDVIAYSDWNSLSLNKEYQARNMNSEVEIANFGTFENKDIRITWLGVTEMNNKICAILKYAVMNNPVKMKLENMSMNGRSHYWGEIYVSLSDKQIEYATLSEDVLTDIKMSGVPDPIIGYTIRYITFSRVK